MERKVSGKKYLIAFILTVVIFTGGILIGILFEDLRLQDSKDDILSEKVVLQSLQLQQKYIDSGAADCATMNTILETNIADLNKKMKEVIDYEKNSFINTDQFNLQLQDYFLTEIQFLLLSEEIDKKCSKDNVKILYFYDDSAFDTQGNILDYLKKVFGSKVLVFSLDSGFQQEPMIKILLTSYNITQFPSVVVEDTVLQGHSSVELLMQQICNEFEEHNQETPPQCNDIQGNRLKKLPAWTQ
jgi:hypothetical protein